MSTVTAPVTVTPGASSQLVLPTYGASLATLVLDNLSTYLLAVTCGSNTTYQSPLVEAKYDLSGNQAPIQITAIALAGDTTTDGVVAPTWYGPGELPAGVWPIALSGPAEVAAATAAALLENGVPNVSIIKREVFEVTFGPGVQNQYDLTDYSMIYVVFATSGDGNPTIINYGWNVIGPPPLDVQQQSWFDTYSDARNPTSTHVETLLLKSRGAEFFLQNASDSDIVVSIYGSNQVIDDDILTPWQGSQPQNYTTGSVAMIGNQAFEIVTASPGPGGRFQPPSPSGLVSLTFRAATTSSATPPKGRFELHTISGDGVTTVAAVLADTSEMHADPVNPLFNVCYKQAVLPRTPFQLFYISGAAGTFTGQVFIVGNRG